MHVALIRLKKWTNPRDCALILASQMKYEPRSSHFLTMGARKRLPYPLNSRGAARSRDFHTQIHPVFELLEVVAEQIVM